MTKRILVIEDTEDNRQIVSDLLQSVGYELIEAVDGLEGVATAEREQPDLILMDIQLPGMDGLAATAILKQDPHTRSIPVIALSALAMKADEERSRAAGCDAFIAKPLRYQQLYEAMDHLLATRAL
jgi:two-component system cell cycle response regulator DivK